MVLWRDQGYRFDDQTAHIREHVVDQMVLVVTATHRSDFRCASKLGCPPCTCLRGFALSCWQLRQCLGGATAYLCSFDPAARRLALAARPLQKHFACRQQFTATHQFDIGVWFRRDTSEYEFWSRHSASHTSSSTVAGVSQLAAGKVESRMGAD